MISSLQSQFLGQVKEFGSTQLALQIMCLSFMQCDQRVDVFVYLS